MQASSNHFDDLMIEASVEQDQDSHKLAQSKLSGTGAMVAAGVQTLLMPERFKLLTEVIDRAVAVVYTHAGLLCDDACG